MNIVDIKKNLELQKNNFLDEKHLDWYVLTFIRNYPEFLENDYNNAMTLAKQHIDDYEQLTQYIVDLNKSLLRGLFLLKFFILFIPEAHLPKINILDCFSTGADFLQ